MEEDIKVLEELKQANEVCIKSQKIEDSPFSMLWKRQNEAIENLIKGYKELEEYKDYANKVNEILNVDTDNLDTILIKNNQEGLKRCVTKLEIENKTLKALKNSCPEMPTTGMVCEFKKDLELLEERN